MCSNPSLKKKRTAEMSNPSLKKKTDGWGIKKN